MNELNNTSWVPVTCTHHLRLFLLPCLSQTALLHGGTGSWSCVGDTDRLHYWWVTEKCSQWPKFIDCDWLESTLRAHSWWRHYWACANATLNINLSDTIILLMLPLVLHSCLTFRLCWNESRYHRGVGLYWTFISSKLTL